MRRRRRHPDDIIREDEYVDICPTCGSLFHPNFLGRRKRFCSEECRLKWNHKHPKIQNWKDTSRKCICPECGKEFTATREYGHLRKYCSHACANKGRAAEKRHQGTRPGKGEDHAGAQADMG